MYTNHAMYEIPTSFSCLEHKHYIRKKDIGDYALQKNVNIKMYDEK